MFLHSHKWVTRKYRWNHIGNFIVACQTCECGAFREKLGIKNYKDAGLTESEFLQLAGWEDIKSNQ